MIRYNMIKSCTANCRRNTHGQHCRKKHQKYRDSWPQRLRKDRFCRSLFLQSEGYPRLGNRTDGNTVMDFDPEEIRRQISINTSLASFNWNEYKVNMLDTPGDYDFLGEVASALRVADSALITVSSRDNEIAVGTEKAVAQAKKNGVPYAFFINRLDEPNANFVKVLG